MNNARYSFSTSFQSLIWLMAFAWAGPVPAEIVYDNTQTPLESFYPSSTEYGDEVILGGTARTLTGFQVEYYGEFTTLGNESAQIRFYANDATSSEAFNSPPGTLLYASGPLAIAQGYNVLSVTNLALAIPDHFTWTIQFSGLKNKFGSRAGVVFYSPPTVGSSFDDYWQKDPTGWGTYTFTGGFLKANFAARVFAGPDPAAEIVSLTPSNAQMVIGVTGPTYHSAVLERFTTQKAWTPVSTVTFSGEALDVVDRQPGSNYRIRLLPETVLSFTSTKYTTNREYQLRISGEMGQCYRLETSPDLVHWSDVTTNYFSSIYDNFTDTNTAGATRKFYRATYTNGYPVYAGTVTRLTNGLPMIAFGGPPGRPCVIQGSADLKQWSSLSTNAFSFSSGLLNWIDATAPSSGRRYYRAVSPLN